MIQAFGVQSITPRCNDTPRRVAAWRQKVEELIIRITTDQLQARPPLGGG